MDDNLDRHYRYTKLLPKQESNVCYLADAYAIQNLGLSKTSKTLSFFVAKITRTGLKWVIRMTSPCNARQPIIFLRLMSPTMYSGVRLRSYTST